MIAAVQGVIRRRILRLFVRRALLDADDAKDMGACQHDGGFSLDASVRILKRNLSLQPDDIR